MKKRNFLSILLAATLAFSCGAVAGCDNGDGGTSSGGDFTTVKDGTTALQIAYYAAGNGNAWLVAAAQAFELAYQDYSFEEGKRGVSVVFDPRDNSDMFSSMSNANSHIYFSDAYANQHFYGKGIVANITNAVTTSLGVTYGKDLEGTPLPGFAGETKSIAEKMTDSEKAYFILNENGNDAVFGVPHIAGMNVSLNYDPTMFEEFGLYYKADNTLGGKKSTGEALGTGPDGVSGNADDGLPRTYAELFAICEVMRQECYTTPFVWAGNWAQYLDDLAMALAWQNLGSKNAKDALTGSGTIPDFVYAWDKDGKPLTKEASYTPETFDSVFRKSESFYRALEFIYTIVHEGYCNEDNSYTISYTHEMAQGDFILGKRLPKNKGKNYGFLVDGSWWYTEAEEYWTQLSNRTQGNENKQTRPLLYMPLPKATEESFQRTVGENTFFHATQTSGMVIKEGLSDMQKLLAETFIRFYCTDEWLAKYPEINSQSRGLKFEMSKEQYDKLSSFGQCMYNIHNRTNGYETAVKVEITTSPFLMENATKLANLLDSTSPVYGSLTKVVTNFHDYPTLTPEHWFSGIGTK